MPNFLINVSTRGVKGASSGIKRLSGSLMNLSKVAMVGAAGGAIALGVAMKKAADSAGVQEAAERKLQTALGHTNKKLLEQASAFQQQSKFGDEALIEMMALASNMGIAENQIAETTQMAIGLSEALGVDMNMAMKAAAGAIQGDTNMLTRYIPELKTTKDATEKLAIVQTAANKGFEQSKALTDTMAGSMNQAKMAIGDAAESLGMLIEPLIRAGATMSKEFAIKAGEAFKSLENIDFGKTFENMKTNMGALTGMIKETFELVFKALPDLFGFWINKIVPIMKKTIGLLWEGIKAVSAFLWEPIGIGIQIVIAKVKNFFIGMVNFAKEQFNTLAGFANKLGADIQPMEMSKLIDTEGLSMANSAMVQLLTEGSQDNIDTFGEYATAQAEIYKKYAEQVIAINEDTNEKTGGIPIGGLSEAEVEKQKTFSEQLKGFWSEQSDVQKKNIKEQAKLFGKNMQTMGKAFPEMEKAGKRAAQVQALVDTYASANAAYKAMVGIPLVGPGLAIAASAAAIGAGLANVKMIEKAATGANFVTSGPQMMMVGDNPSGQERVQVTPLGGDPNIDGPQGGGSVTVNVSGNVMSQDYVEGELAEQIKEAVRRGNDFGIG